MRQQLAALLDVANRDDSNGEYLFAGTSTSTKPFALGTTGVNYQGDLTNRQIRIFELAVARGRGTPAPTCS